MLSGTWEGQDQAQVDLEGKWGQDQAKLIWGGRDQADRGGGKE